MDDESLPKFRAQAELLSSKEIERAVKKLNKEEVERFIETIEQYNDELRRELERARSDLERRVENHKVLLEDVREAVPKGIARFLGERCGPMENGG